MFKILATNDLHGKPDFYRKIEYKAVADEVRAIIIAGDLLPKDGAFAELPIHQKQFISETLLPWLYHMKDDHNIPVYLTFGNDDLAAVHQFFQDDLLPFDLTPYDKKGLPHSRMIDLENGMQVMGFLYCTTTPFSIKDIERIDLKNALPYPLFSTPVFSALQANGEIQYKTIEEYQPTMQALPSIEELLDSLPKPRTYRKTLFVSHNPPRSGLIDYVIIRKALGSLAIKDYILNNQPLISLHGHIHESPALTGVWATYLGDTLCINPGQAERCHYVILDLDDLSSNLIHSIYGEFKEY